MIYQKINAKKLILISLVASCAIAFSLFAVPLAMAATPACGSTLTADTVFDSNMVCSGSGSAIIMAGSIVLDCAGRTISGGNAGAGIELVGQGMTVKNCAITNFEVGIHAQLTSLATISNNTISNSTRAGIFADLASNGSFLGNTLTGNGIGIDFGRGGWSNTISGNTITGSNGTVGNNAGSAVAPALNYINNFTSNTISNNIIQTNSGHAVVAGYGSTITNNSISGNTNGIWAFRSMVATNTVSGSQGAGIEADSDSNNVTGNTTFNNGTGVHLELGSNNSVTNNNIYNNNGMGLSIHAVSSSVLSNNTITGNLKNGIYYNSSSGNTISGNTVSNNSGSAIAPAYNVINYSTNNTISNNIIQTNSEYAVVAGYGSTITNNSISGNASGIWAFRSMVATNTVSGSQGIGIELSSDSNNVTGNTAFNNGTGIHIESSNNSSVTNNNIYNNNGVGLAVGVVSSSVFSNNTITGNLTNGIFFVSNSGNTISGNIITGNLNNGIFFVSNSGNTINGNTLNNNLNGIYFQSSSNNTLDNNTINGNTQNGVFFDGNSSNNSFTGNTISSNGTDVSDSGSNNMSGSVNPDIDGDGIANAIDRNASTNADESTVFSNDFNDGASFGTIANRGGGLIVAISDLPSPAGVRVVATGSGTTAKIITCNNNIETQLQSGESADITCGSTTATAVQTAAEIVLRKPSTGTGGKAQTVKLSLGQTVTLGSPITPGKDNSAPIVVNLVDENDNPLGGSSLSPGQILDIEPAATGEVLISNSSITLQSVSFTMTDNTMLTLAPAASVELAITQDPITSTITTVEYTNTSTTDVTVTSGSTSATLTQDASVAVTTTTEGTETFTNTGTTSVTIITDGTVATIASGGSLTDQCPGIAGNVGDTGCPFADKTTVILHTVDQQKSGVCGTLPDGKPRPECKKPLSGATVKVFDRERADFIAAYGANRPQKNLLNVIYESNLGKVGSCATGADGSCFAGEDHPGKFLAIAKFQDGNKSVYTGKFKNFKRNVVLASQDEDDTDTDAASPKDTLITKTLRFLKTIKKDGSVGYQAGAMTVVSGSELDVLYPEYAIWNDNVELYPFVLTSDDNWTVDVCLQVPAGYQIAGLLDENGNLVSTSNCSQSLVAGQSVVIFFSVKEIGSPEPNFGLSLTTNHKGKKTKQDLTIGGIRKNTKNLQDREVREKVMREKQKQQDQQKGKAMNANLKIVALKDGDTLWSLTKETIGTIISDYIKAAAKALARYNGINVPEWGIDGGTRDVRKLLVGSLIDLAPLSDYLKR